MSDPETTNKGLYGKYEVRKNGEPVEDCFVLDPESDPAARVALSAYADATDDDSLAEDLREWLAQFDESAEFSGWYVLTDADGDPIPGEYYSDPERAIDARARLMADHEDGDEVTVEPRSEDSPTDPEQEASA